jgi:23S rRNA pseudouridine2604 synthase
MRSRIQTSKSVLYSPPMENPEFPMRINKYLAWKQYATRRGADEMISQKKVLINKRVAVLGDKVNKDDIIEVKGAQKKKQNFLYYAYHKAKDSNEHPKLAFGIRALVTLGEHDRGLVIYTNDGRITDAATNPETSPEKEYVVTTHTEIRANFAKIMESGVEFEEFVSGQCRVKVVNEHTFVIALREQKKNQVRRMCTALRNEVTDLLRTRVANVAIGQLAEGQSRPIKGEELEEFLKTLGFN